MIKGIFHCFDKKKKNQKKRELDSNSSEINQNPEKYWVGTGGWHRKLKHWYSKHHETSMFTWLWLTALNHQLPVSTDGMGTQLQRSISCWAWQYQKGCRKPERSSVHQQLESSSSLGLCLFFSISVTCIKWLCLFPHFQNQTMTFTCYPEH